MPTYLPFLWGIFWLFFYILLCSPKCVYKCFATFYSVFVRADLCKLCSNVMDCFSKIVVIALFVFYKHLVGCICYDSLFFLQLKVAYFYFNILFFCLRLWWLLWIFFVLLFFLWFLSSFGYDGSFVFVWFCNLIISIQHFLSSFFKCNSEY